MIIAPPVRGGEDFAGKSGRKTANVCEANAMETSTIAAAHFMSCGLIKIKTRGKKILRGRGNHPNPLRTMRSTRFTFTIRGLRLLLPADATVYLSCAECAGRFG